MFPFEKRAIQQYLLSKGLPFNAVERDSSSTAAVSPSTRTLVTRKTTPSLRSLQTCSNLGEQWRTFMNYAYLQRFLTPASTSDTLTPPSHGGGRSGTPNTPVVHQPIRTMANKHGNC
jgi:hypothetical protein